MKWNSTITAIGSEALDPKDNVVILFDNKVTDKLRDVAVLQSLFLKKTIQLRLMGQHIYLCMLVQWYR